LTLTKARALPPDIGVIHYAPGKLAHLLSTALRTKDVHTLPVVRLNDALAFLEQPLQRLGEKMPYLALPFASAFILLARKPE
jgi:hypothetical protein